MRLKECLENQRGQIFGKGRTFASSLDNVRMKRSNVTFTSILKGKIVQGIRFDFGVTTLISTFKGPATSSELEEAYRLTYQESLHFLSGKI